MSIMADGWNSPGARIKLMMDYPGKFLGEPKDRDYTKVTHIQIGGYYRFCISLSAVFFAPIQDGTGYWTQDFEQGWQGPCINLDRTKLIQIMQDLPVPMKCLFTSLIRIHVLKPLLPYLGDRSNLKNPIECIAFLRELTNSIIEQYGSRYADSTSGTDRVKGPGSKQLEG